MPTITPDLCLALWNRALDSEIGLAIETDDKRGLINLMYKVRQDAKNPELEKLIMVMPGKYENEIWLAKKAVELN